MFYAVGCIISREMDREGKHELPEIGGSNDWPGVGLAAPGRLRHTPIDARIHARSTHANTGSGYRHARGANGHCRAISH